MGCKIRRTYTMKNKPQLKQQLLNACHRVINERISLIGKNLESLQESRNNETKSSAGDKYETGRAMLQIEEDNHKKQLHQALLLSDQLQQIDPVRSADCVDRGSLVITNQLNYFISVGLGELTLEGKSYFCVSPASPIGQKLMGQKERIRFEFNGKEVEIQQIW